MRINGKINYNLAIFRCHIFSQMVKMPVISHIVFIMPYPTECRININPSEFTDVK